VSGYGDSLDMPPRHATHNLTDLCLVDANTRRNSFLCFAGVSPTNLQNHLIGDLGLTVGHSAMTTRRVGFGPLVSRLYVSGCPSDVTGFVVPVIVNTINAVDGGRARPNIGQERCERGAPSFADCDSAPAIQVIPGILRVEAALAHTAPGVIFRRSSAPVPPTPSGGGLPRETAAGADVAVAEVSPPDRAFVAAVTAHQEATMATVREFGQFLDYRESSESGTGHKTNAGVRLNRHRGTSISVVSGRVCYEQARPFIVAAPAAPMRSLWRSAS